MWGRVGGAGCSTACVPFLGPIAGHSCGLGAGGSPGMPAGARLRGPTGVLVPSRKCRGSWASRGVQALGTRAGSDLSAPTRPGLWVLPTQGPRLHRVPRSGGVSGPVGLTFLSPYQRGGRPWGRGELAQTPSPSETGPPCCQETADNADGAAGDSRSLLLRPGNFLTLSPRGQGTPHSRGLGGREPQGPRGQPAALGGRGGLGRKPAVGDTVLPGNLGQD